MSECDQKFANCSGETDPKQGLKGCFGHIILL